MIEVGKIQRLEIKRKDNRGLYLSPFDAEDGEEVLLPGNQYSGELEIGDQAEVFVYKEPDGQVIATTKKPKITLGELAMLEAVEVKDYGIFLDWGLDKDLLLPSRKKEGRVRKGDLCLVGLYIDKNTDNLCATMQIYDLLSSDSPYQKNEMVQGTVYKINKDIGFFIAVDDRYHGLVLNKELYGEYRIGDPVEVRIKNVREDGKLELSFRKQAYSEIESDAQRIMDLLKAGGGKLPLNDSSSPEEIKKALNISKKAFKRAVGRLLKEGAIKTTEKGIEANW